MDTVKDAWSGAWVWLNEQREAAASAVGGWETEDVPADGEPPAWIHTAVVTARETAQAAVEKAHNTADMAAQKYAEGEQAAVVALRDGVRAAWSTYDQHTGYFVAGVAALALLGTHPGRRLLFRTANRGEKVVVPSVVEEFSTKVRGSALQAHHVGKELDQLSSLANKLLAQKAETDALLRATGVELKKRSRELTGLRNDVARLSGQFGSTGRKLTELSPLVEELYTVDGVARAAQLRLRTSVRDIRKAGIRVPRWLVKARRGLPESMKPDVRGGQH